MEGVGPPHQPEAVVTTAEVGVPVEAHEVAIAVDVVCPDRLARQGFAVAPFYLRAPAASLNSLGSLFAALKFGALADETEVWTGHSRGCTPARCERFCLPESAPYCCAAYVPYALGIEKYELLYPASSCSRSWSMYLLHQHLTTAVRRASGGMVQTLRA